MNRIWRLFGRPFAAWLFASIMAALVFAVGATLLADGIDMSLRDGWDLGQTIAKFTALPAAALIWLGRFIRAPRGVWDMLVGLVMPVIVILIITGGAVITTPFLTDPIGLAFLLAGAAGGLIYWLASGRPRPPYGRSHA